MLLTRSKGGGAATNVDDLKKQASAAAVAKAVEVIKAGGTQAEAAAAAKGVARDILAKGQQQMLQKPQVSNKKGGGKGGLMGKLRKNKNKKDNNNNRAVASKPMKSPATSSALPSTAVLSRVGTLSPDPESITTGSRTDSRSESSGDAASSFSSSSGRVTEDEATSKASSKESSTSSKPSLYLDESLAGTNEDMSLITDGNTSRSTIHVTDLLNMGGVMNAIDTALEEKDIEREMRGGKKHWIDRILDCDMCLGVESSDNSFVSSGSGDGTILSKDAPSVLSSSGRGGSNNGGGGGSGNNALETVEEEKESPSSHSTSANAASKAKDSSPSSSERKSESKTEGSAEEQSKLDQSGSIRKKSDAPTSAASGSLQPPLSNVGSKSPVTVNSKSSTKSGGEDDSLSANAAPTPWKQFLGIAQGAAAPSAIPNKQESTQATQPKPVAEKQMPQRPQQQVQQQQQQQQQQQVIEERQDANLDWRSQVTDEAPNPNPRVANRAATYDPKKSNPSVFIPPTAQPTPQGDFINFGANGYGSPMNGQGYGYGGPPGSPQNYYPQHPTSSPYGNNPASSYGQFPPGTNNVSQGAALSLDEASMHSSRVDRYGGDEDAMISDAAAKSKSQLEGAASFVYRVLSGVNGDDATVSTNDQEQQKYKQEQQYGQYGGPPPMHYYPPPPQQFQGRYSPHHHQQQQQQQYPPQQQYQQNYPPQQQQQQQYPPQEQYQQNYPPTNIDPNPSSAAYYDQVQVSSPTHNQRFAA